MFLFAGISFPATDPILIFLILALLLLAAPLLAERLRIPDLVILLVAGAIIGPNGFDLITRDTAITMLGSVGILYIMFLAGLEIDISRLGITGKYSITFALLTFAIPQGIGTLVGLYVLNYSWTTSILLASMFASHTLLAYPIASRFGITRSEPVAVTVGATIITDTLALLVLAIIADSTRNLSTGWEFWVGFGAGVFVLVLLIMFGLPWLARYFFQKISETGSAQFMFVLLAFCACAYASHFAKLEPIIGAFLAGAAFNRIIPEHSALMNRVVFVGNTLFIPFFLISVGMLVNPGALLSDSRGWLVMIVMVVTVVVTKFAAAWVGQKLFGYSKIEGRVMFGLSVVQAAATLAAVLVGYDLKIFNDTVLNGAIMMIMVTVPLGAWTVDRYGRKMAEQIAVRAIPMRVEQRIMVPVFRPNVAARMLDLAFLMRNTATPGAIHPITIVRDEGDTAEAVAKGEKLLAYGLSQAAAVNIPVTPSVRVDMNISDGIIRAAKELRSSVVLAEWTVSYRHFFNTVMDTLLENCPTRLYFCRLQQPLNIARRLLLVFPPLAERRPDLSQVIREVKHLARQAGTEVRVYLGTPAGDTLRQELEAAHPTVSLTFIEAESWGEVRARLFDEAREDDILMLPVERRGGVFWTPTLEKLPELIIGRFPNINLLLVYPALRDEVAAEEALEGEQDGGTPEGIVMLPAILSAGTELGQALRQLVESGFKGNAEARAELLPLLDASARSYPVELTEGVVLLHAHAETLKYPVLLAGCGSGYVLPNLPTPARVILALVSPTNSPPEAHLRSLAGLARRFHDAEIAQAVAQSQTGQEVCEHIAGEGLLLKL